MESDPGKILNESYARILCMEFFREANLSFDLADGPKFKAMYEFMSSGFPAPTSRDFQEIHSSNEETLNSLDNVTYPTDNNYKRQIMANGYTSNIMRQIQGTLSDGKQELNVGRILEEPAPVVKTEPMDDLIEITEQPAIDDPLPSQVMDVWTRECSCCLERKHLNQLRRINRGNQPTLILLILYRTNQLTMKEAKSRLKTKSFYICTEHLDTLCESAKFVFGTANPEVDFNSRMPAATVTYDEFVQIKDEKPGTVGGLGHFVITVKQFFRTYRRVAPSF